MRGEVWHVRFRPPRGSEPGFDRPAIVIQNEDFDRLATVIVIPTTSKLKRATQRGNVLLKAGTGGLPEDCVALCHQISCVDKSNLLNSLGELPPQSLSQIETVLAYVLGLAL
ncbi:MAG: type II toxin-antitoxin system PemK/MazF family toxin [Chloroflexi bacterium]|nr:type II toxin-antitoxin system PemK/MazF family toxin [Chloroflexota bacterium]